jgi:hypothetical protein
MFVCYPTANPQWNTEIWASQMHRNSLRIAPVSAILPTNSTLKHQKNSSDTWSGTNTGRHWKWSQPVAKSPPQEISQDKYLDTEVSHSKSSASDMLTLLETSVSFVEKHDCKTQKIDKTASHLTPMMPIIESWNANGSISSMKLYEPHEMPTVGLSLTA